MSTVHEAAVRELTHVACQAAIDAVTRRAAALVDGEQKTAFIISVLGMAYVSAAVQLSPDRTLALQAIREQIDRMIALVEKPT